MKINNTSREKRRIRELIRKYEKMGYSVSESPTGHDLPDFLQQLGYIPDLIVESEMESLVIEVSSRNSAERLREISKVVSTIEEKRGWQFVLVMTNPNISQSYSIDHKLPTLKELQKSFKMVENLQEISNKSNNLFAPAVILSAWSIVEGALRMYLYTGRKIMPHKTPRSIVRDAVMYGFITSGDGEFLDSVAIYRNLLAHGSMAEKFRTKNIKRLVNICKSLVSEI